MGEQRARVDALTLNARDWPRHRATVTDTATPRARRAPRDEAQFSSDSLHAIAEGGGRGGGRGAAARASPFLGENELQCYQ
jgi:hypothetical protein